MLCDRVSFRVRLVDESLHAIGGVNLPLAQGRMDESVAKSLASSGAVVVATDTQACNQRMIHGLLVVTVVSGSVLLAVNFNGKAVDVDRRVCDAASPPRR